MTHTPRKRFGQNFLHETHIIERIISSIRVQPNDALVEIGPGEGALTYPLLASGLSRLDVIELDRDLAPRLSMHPAAAGKLQVHQADALRFDFTELAKQRGGARLRVIGNLPYNISTPLLFHLLDHSAVIQDLHVMLQLEVAERITAAPNSDDYGRLSAAIAARADAELLFRVAPGAFRPPPKVQSAVLRICPRPPAFPLHDWKTYNTVLTAAFAQRRKTLGNALRNLIPSTRLDALGIDAKRRAETLSAEEFARIANQLEVTP